LGGQHNVRAAGFLGFLLEAVQHENGGFKLRYIDHPESSRSLTDAYFTNAGADAWHWLPIVRFTALLNLIQLVASFSPSIFWKSAQVIEGAAAKRYGFMASCHASGNTKFCIG
jgi:hypothetical protein